MKCNLLRTNYIANPFPPPKAQFKKKGNRTRKEDNMWSFLFDGAEKFLWILFKWKSNIPAYRWKLFTEVFPNFLFEHFMSKNIWTCIYAHTHIFISFTKQIFIEHLLCSLYCFSVLSAKNQQWLNQTNNKIFALLFVSLLRISFYFFQKRIKYMV